MSPQNPALGQPFGRSAHYLYSYVVLSPLAEKSLIAQVRRHASADRRVIAGIGDDCAILRIPPGHEALITTDFTLEGIHFRRAWHPPQVVGHRCLTRGLSDIAAMGGEPIAAFLSLAVPADLPQKWVDDFLAGFLSLAREFGVTLAGGDTAESPDGILADVIVLGSAPRGKAIRRSGAHTGDRIYVTGELGGSAATLDLLFSGRKLRPADFPRHFCPIPRLEIGRVLRLKALASAMIDTSDGLSTDLAHICEESEVGAEIDADRLPLAEIGRPARPVNLNFALHGGEDYELLFTVPKNKLIPRSIGGIRITEIGEIRRSPKIYLTKAGRRSILKPLGWQHFKS